MTDEKLTASSVDAESGGQTPGLEEIEEELERADRKNRFRKLPRSTVDTLTVAAACAMRAAVPFVPAPRISGSSMHPTLNKGKTVVSIKGSSDGARDVMVLIPEANFSSNESSPSRDNRGTSVRTETLPFIPTNAENLPTNPPICFPIRRRPMIVISHDSIKYPKMQFSYARRWHDAA